MYNDIFAPFIEDITMQISEKFSVNVRSALRALRFAQAWLDLSASPATGSQIHYQVDSPKYLNFAKQTQFVVSCCVIVHKRGVSLRGVAKSRYAGVRNDVAISPLRMSNKLCNLINSVVGKNVNPKEI